MATVGTETSDYPAAIPAFVAQTETADPGAQDPDLAEGRDANKWSAEIIALAQVLGLGARGGSLLTGASLAIGDLKVLVADTLVTMPLTPALALTPAVPNFIYANLDTALYVAATAGFPVDGTRFVPIATWDGFAPAVVDVRPNLVAWGSPLWAPEGPGMAVESISAKGQKTAMQIVEGFVSGIVGATHTFAGLIPAGSVVLGVTSRVTAAITGAVTFDLGDGIDVDKFGAALPIASSSTSDLTDSTVTAPSIYASATDVVATANGGAFTAGDLRVSVHYLLPIAPTS